MVVMSGLKRSEKFGECCCDGDRETPWWWAKFFLLRGLGLALFLGLCYAV